ncbi:hypothetical protein HKX42_09705 [Salinisphaera sp. USBA-960]|uniref:Abi-alpha family protein n=1 Tax=Salinisphaera orenii TaxID=856731 RepID=UPI000DBE7D24|nr:hypothetical protein [Salifodinibacter halophilus]NNC27148.1 hypothetical protein [Salifodinibacter halophilus]
MPETKQSPRAGDFSWKRELHRLTDDWPVANRVFRGMADSRHRALIELKQQLDAVEQEAARASQPTIAELMSERLALAEQVDVASAIDALYRRTLAALVPDELLMVRRLVTVGEAPLAHIGVARWPFGRARWWVLENATPLGRDAGVALPDRVDVYIRQLKSLALVDEVPAGGQLETGFEQLGAETGVRRALETIRGTTGQRPRFERRSLRPSSLATALIQAGGISSDAEREA